jgi:2-oxoglutarate ferredoxin oxidoreductase subunit alpha
MAETRDVLAADGLRTSYLRVRAYPFAPGVRAFLESHDRVYVVEQNRDAQMAALLRMDCPDLAPRIRSILHYDGMPIDAESVVNGIRNVERMEVAVR